MNKALFFARIREKSLKMEQVARELSISTQALYLRVEGRRNFKMREFLLLIKMLNLTGPQIKEIFFYEQEQEQKQKHKPE